MNFRILDPEESISDRHKQKTIEEIRTAVASNDKNIKVSSYEGKTRASIYRNYVKVLVVEISGQEEAQQEEYSPQEVRAYIKAQILAGAFDQQLTDGYREANRMNARKRRAAQKK